MGFSSGSGFQGLGHGTVHVFVSGIVGDGFLLPEASCSYVVHTFARKSELRNPLRPQRMK